MSSPVRNNPPPPEPRPDPRPDPRIVEVAVVGVGQLLSYQLPDHMPLLEPGTEVIVPVGKGQRCGWVVAQAQHAWSPEPEPAGNEAQLEIFSDQTPRRMKSVAQYQAAFLPNQIPLFQWMSEYYGVPIADILEAAMPKRHSDHEQLCVELSDRDNALSALPSLRTRAPKQAEVLQALLDAPEPLLLETLEETLPSARGACTALKKKNLITLRNQARTFSPRTVAAAYVQAPDGLTPTQERAVEKIADSLNQQKFDPFLLLGVTGSGKTEVYIQAIRHALSLGGSALLLVPEISLTPQLVDQLSTRLAIPLALLHSQVGGYERWKYWQGLRDGQFRVAVGARSALFAPIPNLRLIIVDEEHETSYKQSDGLRYHGRDVAVMRAKTDACTLLLGSATPSLETLYNVQRKRYRLLELPERVHQRPVPAIEIIDLMKIPTRLMPAPTISPPLFAAIETSLKEKEQIVILYNKRGFSSYLQCDSCGEAVCCPQCSVSLTYHKGKEILLCHYCGLQVPTPEACGFCRNPATMLVEEQDAELPGTLSHRGAGTERVVEDIQALFPEARLVRMDRDTVGAKDAYREILSKMRRGEADILIGTQMIAKGHDLPGVTLVGIIDADVGLHIPDFRTSERVYQLITQAAGRAGRGSRQGRVLVQTRQANHPTIVATAGGRFKAFARFQLEQREKLKYPPYGRLLRVVISASDQRTTIAASEELAHRIALWTAQRGATEGCAVLGPAPAPHQRLRGLYRWHILVKAHSATLLSQLASVLQEIKSTDPFFKKLRLAIDVDPVDML